MTFAVGPDVGLDYLAANLGEGRAYLHRDGVAGDVVISV